MLDYRPAFLNAEDAWRLFEVLCHEVPWQEETLSLYGRPVAVPRLLGWCGDPGVIYRYSGADHPCSGWHPALDGLRDRLEDQFGLPCNLALLNRYRDGADYMGWHRDDEPGHASRLASLSLGAPRRFLLRAPGASRSRRLDLEHGSLLLMDGRWRHSLPRTRRVLAERINVTFRRLDGDAGRGARQ